MQKLKGIILCIATCMATVICAANFKPNAVSADPIGSDDYVYIVVETCNRLTGNIKELIKNYSPSELDQKYLEELKK